MVLTAALRTAVEEEVLGETLEGAAPLRASSGEIEDREVFLTQAGHRLPPGDTISINGQLVQMGLTLRCFEKVTQGKRQLKEQFSTWQVLQIGTFFNVNIVKIHLFSSFFPMSTFSFFPVPEATHGETHPTAALVPRHVKPECFGELAVQG